MHRDQESRHRRDTEVYDVPEQYAHLSELAAPSPVENASEASLYRHESLEERVEGERRRSHQHERPSRWFRRASTRTAGDGGIELPVYGDSVATAPPADTDLVEERLSRHDDPEEGLSTPKRMGQPSNRDSTSPVPGAAHRAQRSSIPSTGLGRDLEPSGEPDAPSRKPKVHHRRRVGIVSHISRRFTELYAVSYLILFSILATLVRLGLESLTFYPGAPVPFSVLWANFAGSLILGFLTESSQLFSRHKPSQERDRVKRDGNQGSSSGATDEEDSDRKNDTSDRPAVTSTPPLYIGLATGFCGSLTSFSSFILDTFRALSNSLLAPQYHTGVASTSAIPRGVGMDIMAALAVIIVTLCVSLCALKVGAHIAIIIGRYELQLPFRLHYWLDRCTIFFALGTWLGAIIMAAIPPDRPSGPNGRGSWAQETWRGQALFAIALAPIGCLLRFYVSLKLNFIFPAFPLGTFTVNIAGTAALGMAWDLQHAPLGQTADMIGGGRLGCQVLQGVMDGFCGCLTTVSTWATELQSLRRVHAYLYGAVSVGASLVILIVVMGTMKWTTGWKDPVCVSDW